MSGEGRNKDKNKHSSKHKDKAYIDYQDRLSMQPCIEELTKKEIKRLKEEGRI